MFCPNCGTNAPDGAKACPNCGTFLNAQPEAPVYQEAPAQQPIYNAAPVAPVAPVSTISDNTTPILVFGILALALAGSTGIVGIIFGILTKKKVNEYLAQGGTLTGKAKVGSILGKVGLILGIVMTVFWIISVVASVSLSAYSYY